MARSRRADAQRFGDGIVDSPIVDRKGSLGAFLVATYAF